MSIVLKLGLSGNPFEHYTAETEPNIADYAVRPPYLDSIAQRARGLSSFVLFGDRGAGKSATRITVYKEVWRGITDKSPFVVNLTDFASILKRFEKGSLSDLDLVRLAAFVVVEQLLAWLASLEDQDRDRRLEDMRADQRALANALIRAFYLSVPDADRDVSTGEVLRLLNSAWTTKSTIWVGQRWDSISKVLASALEVLAKKHVDESVEVSGAAEKLLGSLVGESASAPRAILMRLVELSQAFGFSGVCILVDKVDETPSTANSAEATARLVYPLLAHIQLLEVAGFSWIFFLWSNVASVFSSTHPVRLDKIANTTIHWDEKELRRMVEERVRFFSGGKLDVAGLFPGVDIDKTFEDLISLAGESPRELIKLLDTIVREHDANPERRAEMMNQRSLDAGQDKYASQTIPAAYEDKYLQQVYRLGKLEFANKDVQTKFRISDQGARVRIKAWVDAGIVRQDGNMPSDAGGKPVNRYVVANVRVGRIIQRGLDERVGGEVFDGDDLGGSD